MKEKIKAMNAALKDLLSKAKIQGDPSGQSLKDKGVIIWVKKFDKKTGTLYIGMALGTAAGCSPFCGCAAHQIGEVIGEALKKSFPEIKKTVGLAELPPNDILTLWKEEKLE